MILKNTKIGRPLGKKKFILDLEKLTSRELMLKTAGRPLVDRK
ncbi:hypothetical protein [uncultured Desulfuromusa sp.]|nr:hypothetical protein [uncultured Desulfuromusa sp.]